MRTSTTRILLASGLLALAVGCGDAAGSAAARADAGALGSSVATEPLARHGEPHTLARTQVERVPQFERVRT